MYYCLLLSYLLLPFWLQLRAQSFDEKNFIRYTTRNGLNDNYVNSIEQDELGAVWIATEAGLNQYDGYAFTDRAATLKANNISGYISTLKKFPSNKLGVISKNGFYLLNPKDLTVRKYVIPDNTSFNSYLNSARDAVMLADHSFAVTTSTGFYVFDESGEIKYRYDAYKPEDIGNKTVRYGRNIFLINGQECIVYFNIYGTAYYHPGKKQYHVIDPADPQWSFFAPPPIPTDDHWLTKFQLSPHQFIFIPVAKDTITYYDHNTKQRIKNALPFHSKDELNYLSKITMLTDTSFVLNGSNQGLWIFHLNPNTGKITCSGKKYFSDYKINCTFVDKEQRLWIGTSEGLLQQKLNPPLLHVSTLTSQLLKDSVQKNLSCIYRYKDKLYAGRYARTSGLVILDTARMKPITTVSFFGSNNEYNEIISIQMYHKDTLWIGSNAGLLWLDTKTNHYGKLEDDKRFPKGVSKLNILAPIGNDGHAWTASFLGGSIARYDPATGQFVFFTTNTKPGVPFTRIKNIVYDSYGDIWFSGHALARWNNRLRIFDTLITVYDGPNKFNDNILTITADNKGSLWLSNVENGLLEYQIQNKKFIHYGVDEGLLSDNIESLSPVANNILWITQRTSLSRFDISTKKIRSFGYNDGLPLHKPTGFSNYYDTITKLYYLLYKNDIVRFNFLPENLADKSSDLIVQQVLVNNTKTFFNPTGSISLKPRENNMVIHYTVIDFESGDDYNFAYRLNKSGTWINLGKQRSITLANLSPGRHSLELKATAGSGIEKIRELTLKISPPFWKTSWFIIAITLMIVGSIYYLYRGRIRSIKQKANLDKLLAQTEMKALHTQMNPHFIFNCLNSIKKMILDNENANASRYLSKFAQLIRLTLNQSSKPFVSLKNTIDYLHRYVEMEQIRNNRFIYEIETDNDLNQEDIYIPPMLIQPFIENSIWHGELPENELLNISIRFLKRNNELICVVEDNGIGIEASLKKKEDNLNHHSLGIANIRQRIQVLNEKYNLSSTLNIEDKSVLTPANGTGTLVTLHLPLKNSDT